MCSEQIDCKDSKMLDAQRKTFSLFCWFVEGQSHLDNNVTAISCITK